MIVELNNGYKSVLEGILANANPQTTTVGAIVSQKSSGAICPTKESAISVFPYLPRGQAMKIFMKRVDLERYLYLGRVFYHRYPTPISRGESHSQESENINLTKRQITIHPRIFTTPKVNSAKA